jgi:hypothetical protein
MHSNRTFVRRALVPGCAFAFLLLTVGANAGWLGNDEARPIIAQIVADPAQYVGRSIEIYGLVVDADVPSQTFMLQDVSQRPLQIDGRRIPLVISGDQIEVTGTIKVRGRDLLFEATSVKRVQVVGGGGCC